MTRVQPVEYALQLFKLLPSLAELAFRRQTLVVGKVFGGFRDECSPPSHSTQESSPECVRTVPESNGLMPLGLPLSEKQIPRFVGNVSS